MRINATEVLLIVGSAIAGVILMLVAHVPAISSLIAGIPSGAGGGCLACILIRVMKRKPTEKTQEKQNKSLDDTSEKPPDRQ